MNLICPECNLTKPATVVPLRLELCPRCERVGRPSYLVTAPEATSRSRPRDLPQVRRRT